MGNLKYARPSDIITSAGLWTVTDGTESTDPDYQTESLYDGNLQKALKWTDDPPVLASIVADFTTARRIDALAIPNARVDSGAVLRAQLNDADVWTAPTVDVPLTFGAIDLEQHRPSPWVDFTTASGYSASGFRYLRLEIPVQAIAPWIGELLVISTLREFSRYPGFSGARGQKRPFRVLMETEYGIKRSVRRKIKMRQIRYPFQGTEQDFADLVALHDDASGDGLPWFCSRDGDVFTDGGLYGRFTPEAAAEIAAAEQWFDLDGFSFDFVEDSRSLPYAVG